MANLKFFRGALGTEQLAQVVVGAIWFDVDTKTIKVCTKVEGENITWEPYAGMLTDATWDAAKAQLTITKADGSSEVLDFSHVASKEEVNTLSQTVTANAETAATGIGEAKAAAAEALAAAGTAEQNAKDYADEKLGVYASEGVEATGLRKEIAEKVAAVDTKVGSVSDRVEALESAVTAEEGLVDRVEALEGLFSGTEGQGVQSMIDASVDALEETINGKLATKVETETYNAKVEELTNAISAEAEAARAAEGANAAAIATEKARVDALVGAKDDEGNFVDAGKSVREIAAEEVAEIVAGADESYDTLKEIADWITNHPEDAAGYNERILANAAAIETLKGTGEGSVAKAVADAKAEVIAEIEANEETTAAALTDLDGRVKAIEDLNVDTELSGIKDRVTAVEGAVATVDSRIAAAEGRVDTKLADYAKTEDMTTALAGKVDNDTLTAYQGEMTTALAGKASTDAVAANAEAIEALQTQVTNGLSWAYFA